MDDSETVSGGEEEEEEVRGRGGRRGEPSDADLEKLLLENMTSEEEEEEDEKESGKHSKKASRRTGMNKGIVDPGSSG